MEIKAMKREYPLQQWQEIFRERRESGLTVKAWCTKREISENSYYYHLKKYRHAACSMLDSCQPAGLAEIPLETKHMVSHMQLRLRQHRTMKAATLCGNFVP